MLNRFGQHAKSLWSMTRLSRKITGLSHQQEAELRATQIRAVLALAPIMMMANIFNSMVVDLLFWRSAHQTFLVGWTVVLWTILSLWFRSWRAQGTTARNRASPKGVKRITAFAFIFSLIWAAPIVFMFGDASEAERVALSTLSVGMLSGGTLALTTVWQAALLFAFTLATPTALILLLTGHPVFAGLAILSIPFSLLICSVVVQQGRQFVESFVTALKMREQGLVISLLLKEFEENSSDWLFETDDEGRLENVSSRLALMLGRSVPEANGTHVREIMQDSTVASPKRLAPGLVALSKAFRQRAAFRSLLVPVLINGSERWWSLTAKPFLDASGAFAGYRGVGSDLTATKQAQASMERMARYDALTGLPNRNLLHLRLMHSIAQLQRDGLRFALLSLDLDRFKNVNDTLGHPVGDMLLVEVSRRITGMLRDADIVARFGGDEFVILQANIRQSSDAGSFAERLVKALGAPYEINGQRILIGASIGVAIAPENGNDADELLRNSDLALYRAKSDGKGRSRFFAAEMDAAMQSRRVIELDLREALENEKLEVFFQPLIEMSTGAISACEALVRWDHPVRGFISPVEFIPIAEETGMIVALGEYVLRKACKEAVSWTRDIRIAVNLSAVQFRAGNLVDLVASVLEESGLPPRRLELEITESILIDDKEDVLRTLNALRDLGVRISLDDFGTGYSSLAYLSSFPFDKIKIDRSFVQDVTRRPDSAAIIRAITGIASTLGMCTTAEGVESIAELDWLRDQGCNEVQGYLFSAPVRSRDLIGLMGMKTGFEPAEAEVLDKAA